MGLSQRPQSKAYWMWGCAVAFYCYQFVLRVSPGVMLNDLMSTFHATASDIGEMASTYLIFYSVLQIPMGMLMDRYGSRFVLSLALSALLLGGWVFGHASTLGQATLGRILMGIGSAPAFIGCSYVIRHWFPQQRVNIMLSATMTVSTLGAINGGVPLAWMIEHMGWRDAVTYVTFLGIILLVVLGFVMRERRETHAHQDITREYTHLLHNLIRVMKIPQVWVTAIAAFGMYLPLSVFGDLWGVNYLVHVLNFSHLEAAWTTSLIYVGVCIGAPCGAWVAQRLQSRRQAILMNATLMMGGLICLIVIPSMPLWFVQCLIFFIGFSIGSEVLCFAICCDWVPKSMTGVTVGLVNTVTMAGGACLQSAVGRCLDWLWDGAHGPDGLRFYSASSYRWSMGVLILCVIGSILCLLYVRENSSSLETSASL